MPLTASAKSPLSRRLITRSAAWAVPAVLLATGAPAEASSPTAPKGCGTLVWSTTSLTGTQGVNATRTGVVTLTDGSRVTVTVTERRTGGQPGRKVDSGATSPTPAYGDFSAASAGGQQAWANGTTSSQGSLYAVNGGTSSVLTLNQGTSTTATGRTRASETLTYSFVSSTGTALQAKSITFNAYDITSQVTNMNNAAYYTDTLSFSGATLTASGAAGSPSAYTVTPTSISSYGTNVSTASGNSVTLTLTPTSPSVSLTYTNTNTTTPLVGNNNYQYVGIGDTTICF